MPRVAIVTDSTACVPPGLIEQYGIFVVPLTIIFEDKAYLDGVDLTASEFFRLLERAERLPTTSAPPPSVYLDAYRSQSKGTADIVCITLSSKLSMGFDSAMQAKEMAKDVLPQTRIEVIDSLTAAPSLGLVVLAAAKAAASGGDLAQVTQAAERVMTKVNLFAVLDTLYYLAKGGRVPKAAAWAASILRVKPILCITNETKGEVTLAERTRTKRKAVERLLEIMKGRVGTTVPVHVFVMHANVPEEAERLKQRVQSQFNCAELYVTDFTPVMGTHTGPGVVGVCFHAEAPAPT